MNAHIITKIKATVNKEGIKALKSGGVMKAWKNSTPSNWWIEDSEGNCIQHFEGFNTPGIQGFNETQSRIGMSYSKAYTLKKDVLEVL